jgi:hypothetical protein
MTLHENTPSKEFKELLDRVVDFDFPNRERSITDGEFTRAVLTADVLMTGLSILRSNVVFYDRDIRRATYGSKLIRASAYRTGVVLGLFEETVYPEGIKGKQAWRSGSVWSWQNLQYTPGETPAPVRVRKALTNDQI